MIEIKNFNVKLGEFELSIEHCTIEKNKLTIFQGKNGTGKTILLEILGGLNANYQGEVSIGKFSPIKVPRKDLGAYLSSSFLIDFLTPKEFFTFILNACELPTENYFFDKELFLLFIGDSILNSKNYIRTLSKGQQARIGISSAFLGSPKYVLLDEPFANLDSESKTHLVKIISAYVKQNENSVILSSHTDIEFSDIEPNHIGFLNGNISLL